MMRHTRAARFAARVMVGAFVTGLSACGNDAEPSTRSQLTVRLYASAEVRERLSSVQVRAYLEGKDDRQASRTLARGELQRWPVDVHVVSAEASNEVSESVEIVAAALGSDGRPLVEQRRITSTVPHEQRVLELWLEACGDRALGNACERDAACRGEACRTCVDGVCASTLRTPGTDLPLLNPSDVLDPEKLSPTALTRGLDGGIDASVNPVAPADGGAPLSCTDDAYWIPVTAHGPIPPGARPFARPNLTVVANAQEPGLHDQYICRVRDPDGTYLHGKVNATFTGTFHWGCYFVRFDAAAGRWVAGGVDAEGATFEVLAPPSTCRLSWVQSTAAQPLPRDALIITTNLRFRHYYACRVEVDTVQGTGTHIGRISDGLGDLCRYQYFSNEVVFESDRFEVLVKEPMAPAN